MQIDFHFSFRIEWKLIIEIKKNTYSRSTTMKSVNVDGRIHRTPTVDFIRVVVPNRPIFKWVSRVI